jgi:hypothetical protein
MRLCNLGNEEPGMQRRVESHLPMKLLFLLATNHLRRILDGSSQQALTGVIPLRDPPLRRPCKEFKVVHNKGSLR